jgi:hypothetical protein
MGIVDDDPEKPTMVCKTLLPGLVPETSMAGTNFSGAIMLHTTNL